MPIVGKRRAVQIETLQVSVKVMTLNSKQVTLSVFRQIEQRSPLDLKFEENVQLWGRVQYRWGKCKTSYDDLVYPRDTPHWADEYLVWASLEGLFKFPILRKEDSPSSPKNWPKEELWEFAEALKWRDWEHEDDFIREEGNELENGMIRRLEFYIKTLESWRKLPILFIAV